MNDKTIRILSYRLSKADLLLGLMRFAPLIGLAGPSFCNTETAATPPNKPGNR